MTKDEDLVWVEKVLQGNSSAFEQLVLKHQDSVYTTVKRILKRDVEAEDITQIVFVKAFEALASFNKNALFSTWLSRIAYNTAISEYRKTKNKIMHTSDTNMQYLENLSYNEDGSSEKEERLQALNNAIEKLEAEESALISFFYTQQLSVEQITQVTGLSNSNVKTKIFRIRKKLHDLMLKEMVIS